MSQVSIYRWAAILSLATIVGLILAVSMPSASAAAAVVTVTNGDDSGPGSYRQAVEDASNDPSITTIRFEPGLGVSVQSSVVYTGVQPLTIDGRGSTVSGAAATADATWDGGLFVSASGADITLRNINFEGSFNNGVAVFIPGETARDVGITLDRVRIDSATFHGLLVDGQAYDGFNTDDIPHPDCEDPHFVNANVGVALDINRSTVTNNGQLPAGYDLSFDTGCPADFDGVRVDQGGDGSIRARIHDSTFDGNLADGLEYDETGAGDVVARTYRSTFNVNGETRTQDLDDGFDIDEAGPGSIDARFTATEANENRDEGFDIDEEGSGDVNLSLVRVTALANEDEGVNAGEEDDGSVYTRIVNSSISDSLSQDGVELEEAGRGGLSASITNATISGNDNEGVSVDQEAPGSGKLSIVNADLSANGDGAVDASGVVVRLVNVAD